MFPEFADGLVPLASNPVEIAGRNRIWRKALVDAIVTDPEWNGGNYTAPPRGMASAIGFLLMATSVPLQWQRQFPTAEAADKYLGVAGRRAHEVHRRQRHDLLLPRVEDYNPEPHLEQIVRPLLAINSADDFVNPPELPMMQALIKRVKQGRFVLCRFRIRRAATARIRCRRSGQGSWRGSWPSCK